MVVVGFCWGFFLLSGCCFGVFFLFLFSENTAMENTISPAC